MRILPLISLLLLAGCIQTNVIATGTHPRAPMPKDSVRVFIAESDAPKDAVAVGLVSATSESCCTDDLLLVRQLQKRAAELGANGVVVNVVEHKRGGCRKRPYRTNFQSAL